MFANSGYYEFVQTKFQMFINRIVTYKTLISSYKYNISKVGHSSFGNLIICISQTSHKGDMTIPTLLKRFLIKQYHNQCPSFNFSHLH